MTFSEEYLEGSDAAVDTVVEQLNAVLDTGEHQGVYGHAGLQALAVRLVELATLLAHGRQNLAEDGHG